MCCVLRNSEAAGDFWAFHWYGCEMEAFSLLQENRSLVSCGPISHISYSHLQLQSLFLAAEVFLRELKGRKDKMTVLCDLL